MCAARGIPTKYDGVMFRSRLEARWAAFFNLMSWKWTYEPFDLDGWIPDFVVEPFDGDRSLVEVKPIPCPPANVSVHKFLDLHAPGMLRKIGKSGADLRILVLGYDVRDSVRNRPFGVSLTTLGSVVSSPTEISNWYSRVVSLPVWKDHGGSCQFFGYTLRREIHEESAAPVGSLSEENYWASIIPKDTYPGSYGWDEDDINLPITSWLKSGNVVQWRGKSQGFSGGR